MLSPLALVTGGASGLGLALVTCLKQRGYDVVILDFNADAGKDAAKSTGSQFIECDVANAADWERVVTTLDHPDCVIERAFLNAVVMTRPPSASLTDDIFAWMDRGAYERVMSINVAGALLGLRAVSTLMARTGGGSITVTASTAALSGLAFDPFYAMSKHAVVGMVRSFAPRLREARIRLNAFCPGGMETAILPHEIAAAKLQILSPHDAAMSCLSVSDQPGVGGIWVRTGPLAPLFQYIAPAVDAA